MIDPTTTAETKHLTGALNSAARQHFAATAATPRPDLMIYATLNHLVAAISTFPPDDRRKITETVVRTLPQHVETCVAAKESHRRRTEEARAQYERASGGHSLRTPQPCASGDPGDQP